MATSFLVAAGPIYAWRNGLALRHQSYLIFATGWLIADKSDQQYCGLVVPIGVAGYFAWLVSGVKKRYPEKISVIQLG